MKISKIDNPHAFFSQQENIQKHKLSYANWEAEYPYTPRASFAIAHTDIGVCLKFFVDEEYTMARVTEDNGEVWTDSCVEFFISFDETGYYNFEFNCIGKMLLGFRKEKHKGEHAPQEILDTIWRESTLGELPFEEKIGSQHWELSVIIPSSAFFKHNIQSLSKVDANVNFYKCGDNLTKPHFLSWARIDFPTPNFHLEEFFGKAVFLS